MSRLSVMIAFAALTIAACTFDSGPLDQRRCAPQGLCPSGQTCVGGFCAEGAVQPEEDIPAPQDIPEPLEPDAPTPEPDPNPVPEPEPQPDVPPDEDVPPDCEPTTEVCDGVDNDCDDLIDEDLGQGESCVLGDGECVSNGFLVCVDGDFVCDALDPSTQPEICDGEDNDCDDETDEGIDGNPLTVRCFDGDMSVVGIGVCAAGVQECDDGELEECEGAVYPTNEICDGLDNDCDGDIDEMACPEDVGCADGRREAFVDLSVFPDIAGCSGDWSGRRSLRDSPGIGAMACGNDGGGGCGVPAELCAPGWQICAADNSLGRLRDALGNSGSCGQAGEGRWVAAMSHCSGVGSWGRCDYDGTSCFNDGDCSEPICCGTRCQGPGCGDVLFDGGTRIHESGSGEGCGAMQDDDVNGVMCCRVAAP